MAVQQVSPFLNPGAVSKAESLAMLHLRRDQTLPIKLTQHAKNSDGYKEGPVTNTRFGSFPHSTLIGLPWGSQVRASVVDTGSRGRKQLNQQSKKRKRGQDEESGIDEDQGQQQQQNGSLEEVTTTPKAPPTAATGFIHLLPPTPELWTTSLPHRTQVVYAPDYSYILHRLQVRPGSVLIEAGAGSGSFSHAAARALFNGYPETDATEAKERARVRRRRIGKVWSYEFHKQRVEKLQEELQEHGLADIIHIAHRDVYQDGFLQDSPATSEPQADAIFLDLPAPWLALRHLTRTPPPPPKGSHGISSGAISQSLTPKAPSKSPEMQENTSPTDDLPTTTEFQSPLNPNMTVRICTFSPCIEQVQKTISTLRELGWVDIELINLAHKRIEIRRERYGFQTDPQQQQQRGVQASLSTVEESIKRLKEIENRTKQFHSQSQPLSSNGNADDHALTIIPAAATDPDAAAQQAPINRSSSKPFKEGRLIHRSEPEIRSHTSYLVFAVLPRLWTAEDEDKAAKRWSVGMKSSSGTGKRGGKKEKKGMKKADVNSGETDDVERSKEVVQGAQEVDS